MKADTAPASLWDASRALAASGRGLMQHVVPDGVPPERWRHYPEGDSIDPVSGARCYYHSHDPGDRADDEHGHFHLFLARRAMPRSARPLIAPPAGRRPRPSTVHIAALSIDSDGLPLRWSATNRWVTDEWLYPAAAIAPLLGNFTLAGAAQTALVDSWLAALIRASVPQLMQLLIERDLRLLRDDPSGEDRLFAVVATAPVDLEALMGIDRTTAPCT